MTDTVKLYGTNESVSKDSVIDMTLENRLDKYDKSSTSLSRLYDMHENNNDDIVKIAFNGNIIEAITLDDAIAMMCKDNLFTKYVLFNTLCNKLPACERKYDTDCEDKPLAKSSSKPKHKCKSIAECETTCDENCPRKRSYDCDINCTDECRRKRVVDDDPECEPGCTLNCDSDCESGYIKTRLYIKVLLNVCTKLKIRVNGIQARAEAQADTILAAKNLLTFSGTDTPVPVPVADAPLKKAQPVSKAQKKSAGKKSKLK